MSRASCGRVIAEGSNHQAQICMAGGHDLLARVMDESGIWHIVVAGTMRELVDQLYTLVVTAHIEALGMADVWQVMDLCEEWERYD